MPKRKKPRRKGKRMMTAAEERALSAPFPVGALAEQRAQLVFDRLTQGVEGMVSIHRWMAEQGWNASARSAVMTKARSILHEVITEKTTDTKDRILAFIEHMLADHCSEYVIGTGEGPSAGSVILKDPTSEHYVAWRRLCRIRNAWMSYESECRVAERKGEEPPAPPSTPWTSVAEGELHDMEQSLPPLRKRNHKAIIAYIQTVMKLTGLDKDVPTTHVGQRPFIDMSNEELIAALAEVEGEIAAKSQPVKVTSVRTTKE